METSMWSSTGRITRKTYWVRWFVVFVVQIGLAVAVPLIAIPAGVRPDSAEFFANALSLPFSIFNIVQSAKRMHDVNKSGWNQLIPFYNLVLLCRAGTPGPNGYGADPLGGPPVDLAAVFE